LCESSYSQRCDGLLMSSSAGGRSDNNAEEQSSWWNKVFGTGGLVGLIVALVPVFSFLYTSHMWPFPSRSSDHTVTPRSHSSLSANSTTSTNSTVPLSFAEPHDNDKEGLVVKVTLFGTVPSGKYLWIFVCHLGNCYDQGKPTSEAPNIWVLDSVNLGSNLPSDVGHWYEIYAVLANSQANGTIKAKFKSTDYGNYGTRTIPGGSGAKKVAQISLYRSH
jgi:hypothetical protein